MKSKSVIFGIVLMTLVSGCGVSQDDYDKLKVENQALKAQLDECRFGAEKIIALVEKAYSEDDYVLARQYIELLNEKHPESPKNAEFGQLLWAIHNKEVEEKRIKEAEEKERLRLTNRNNTGMWSIRYYVDKFGEITTEAYITNTTPIRGTFSNSATEGSALNVDIVINYATEIRIMLYEYAGQNPVKEDSEYWYGVSIQDNLGNREWVRAINYSDRLEFDQKASDIVHKALMNGGTVKFRIQGGGLVRYVFDIQNADWYDNAFRQLVDTM